jgi:hypothetical protein
MVMECERELLMYRPATFGKVESRAIPKYSKVVHCEVELGRD